MASEKRNHTYSIFAPKGGVSTQVKRFFRENKCSKSANTSSYNYNLETGPKIVLMKSSLHIRIPGIAIKDEFKHKYKFALPHGIENQILGYGKLVSGDHDFPSIDKDSMETRSAHYAKSNSGDNNIDINSNETPSSYIEGFPITKELPFFYSDDTSSAFPLFGFNDHSKPRLEFLFNLNIIKLLKFFVYSEEDKKWKMVDVKGKEEWFEKILRIETDSFTLPVPRINSEYNILSDADYSAFLSGFQRNIRRITTLDNCNITHYNNEFSTTIKDNSNLVALFWKVKKISSFENESNYTNHENFYRGKDLISECVLLKIIEDDEKIK
jgi:hypothetical protein